MKVGQQVTFANHVALLPRTIISLRDGFGKAFPTKVIGWTDPTMLMTCHGSIENEPDQAGSSLLLGQLSQVNGHSFDVYYNNGAISLDQLQLVNFVEGKEFKISQCVHLVDQTDGHEVSFMFKIYYFKDGLRKESAFGSFSQIFKSSSQSRFLCFVVIALAKLAKYHHELLPKIARSRISYARVWKCACDYLRLKNE
ncbi:hypothetical protein PanWU01x14_343870 [Parasponia andersonii]|uniref:Uncharacterized protein n=1 Tax=Parasponia andersonii TaxID=3476 RepID=A0A2P5AD82_PARAD|nr:hypothetical protein PanWU01x14_343870 [Parasponia andersonii]